jgi:hypothetical protein
MKRAFANSKPAFKDAAAGERVKYAQSTGNKLDWGINSLGTLRAYGVASCSVFPEKKFAGRNL